MSRRQTCMKFILMLSILPLLYFIGATSTFNHTLKQGDTLTSDQAIYSPNSDYCLTFFAKGFTDKYYLGISQDSVPLWVANRETPILDDSGVLTIDKNGTFMITHTAGNPIVLYSDDGAAGNTRIASLYDNGNLVFRELNSDGSTEKILWQSFDYPTDTLLPDMVLGTFDEKSGRRLSLTSWLSTENPSSGAFTLDWDHMEQQMVVRRRGVIVWTSGILKDGIFPYLSQRFLQDYTPVVSTDGSFLSFSTNKSSYFKLDEEGSLLFYTHNDTVGEVYKICIGIMNMCYGYNIGNGCVEWSQPKCRSDTTKFTRLAVFFHKADSNEIDLGFHYVSASVGPGDCKAICWEDCDCVAYRDADDSGCLFWKGKFHLEEDHGDHIQSSYVISRALVSLQPLNHPLQPSTEGHVQGENTKIKPGRTRKQWIWIAISSLVIPCLLIVVYRRRWKRRGKNKRDAVEKRNEKQLVEDTAVAISIHKDELESNLKLFNLHCLSEATNKFSLENKLGEGGFGPVFKGTLPEGREITVKRLSRSSGQGPEEFTNELMLIAKLQHINLVHLLGYCIQGEEKILIYEYMPNRSLDSFLFDPSKRCLLEYTTRLKIIEGIAQGLHYLHELSRVMIIHRDLKASNILLDESLNPKISDFGMARIFKRNELMANTKRIVGTYGYMSPEYAMDGIFSVKSDVFSFGILILEIMTGRRNNSFYHFDRHINLIGYAWELWQKEAWIELIDPALKEASSMNQIRRIIHVGLLCVEDSASNRHTVSEIISMLTNESRPLPLVKRPAFLLILNTKMDPEYYSINELSLSSVTAR